MSHCCYHLDTFIAQQIMLVAHQSDLLQHIVSKYSKKRERKNPTILSSHCTTRPRRSTCTKAKATSSITFQRQGKSPLLREMRTLSVKKEKVAFALKNISSMKRKQKRNSPSSSINCERMGQIHSIYCDSADNSACVQIIEAGNNMSAMMDNKGGARNKEEEKQGKESRHG